MLSKSQISFVNALHQKKHRKEQNLFIAEGSKTIAEFATSRYAIDTIFYTQRALSKLGNLSQKVKLQEITDDELKKISTLTTPQDSLALIVIPQKTAAGPESFNGKVCFALDGLQDPGNLGTIIRTCDWFGISDVICSLNTADIYNPKVVQASMGSLARVKVCYEDLLAFLPKLKVPVYATLLEAKSVYETDLSREGIIVLGNEGNGITEEVKAICSAAITIPRFGAAESLNVAISAAIICSEIKRNK